MPHSTDPLIGQQLGNYRIERILGRGGMAMVYYAWDTALDRPVAIKIIDARYRNNPLYTQRFLREARIIAQWQHDNIVKIYYAGHQDELYYFAMEYLPGTTLDAWMRQQHDQRGHIAFADVIRIGRSVADALDFAHSHGIVHRDVKPANIIIVEDGRVVLTDFGLALDVAQGSLGEAFGSAQYIAPEQAQRSADAGPLSDLYSLGVILYEMLTNRLPFDDPSPTSLAVQHLTGTVPPPRQFNPNLNAEIEHVLLKALSKSPHQRYPTGKDLMDALAEALQPLMSTPERQITLPPPPIHAALPAAAPPAETDATSLLGSAIDEYRLETLLGAGGMARVYRALDTRLHRYVAIKVIDASHRSDSEYILRFQREARAIAQLEHPAIVRLYRFGETNGLLYMAMQYVQGADLHTVLQDYRADRTWMPLPEVVHIVRTIGEALDYIHSRQVIHRDLKPSNILLDQNGNAFLTDFGLSLLTELGTRGQIFGSPHYIAPEQAISSAGAVPQSDIYSLGVILYEMLTGQVPFSGSNPLEIAMKHLNEPIPGISRWRPELPPQVETVVQKAMAKEPEHRFPSGRALAQALETAIQPVSTHFSSGNTISARVAKQLTKTTLSDPQPISKPKRWKTWLRLTTSTALLTVLITVAWFLFVDPRLGLPALPAISPPLSTTTAPPPATPTPRPTDTPPPATPTQPPTAAPPPATPTPRPTDTPPPATPTQPPTATQAPLLIFTREIDNMPMVQIPAGTFLMGADNNDPAANSDERPQHPVTLDSFYIDQYEVTVAQYAAFLNANGGHAPAACLGFSCVKTQFETLESHLIWNGGTVYQAAPGFEAHPVNNVTWYGAVAYCQWAQARLPTEAEWEYAARGTDNRLYPWGNQPPTENLALFAQTFDALLPVDALPAGNSFFGISGMAGSLWEWTADVYAADYYLTSPNTNPTGPAPQSVRDPRVLRGGGWDSSTPDLRVTARQANDPLNSDNFSSNVGFRCARDAAP